MRTRWVLPVALGMPLGLIGLFVFVMLFHDGRQDIDLEGWVDPQSAFDREMMPNSRWATDELCGGELPMVSVSDVTALLERSPLRARRAVRVGALRIRVLHQLHQHLGG